MELRDRILRALGQHGAMSPKALDKVIPNEPKLEQELQTMVRRRLVEEPFIGSFTLTKRGKTEYEKARPSLPPPVTHAPAWATPWQEREDDEHEQGSIWDDVGEPETSKYDEGFYEGEEEWDDDDD